MPQYSHQHNGNNNGIHHRGVVLMELIKSAMTMSGTQYIRVLGTFIIYLKIYSRTQLTYALSESA